jgi:hypothetical protein
MVIFAAIVLIAGVLGTLGLLLFYDLRHRGRPEWLSELKAWQTLIGSVLGLIGGAGVLVLGNAIETEETRAREMRMAHAIGLGLAIEVEKLTVGLKLGREIGGTIDFAATGLPATCLQFSQLMQRALMPKHPVYDAVLDQMVDFGDTNLTTFVRFYGFYDEFIRALPEVNQAACDEAAADEIRYVLSQINGGLGFYEIIAGNYDIVPLNAVPAAAVPAPAQTTTAPGTS